jgi:hypothetical protein
VRQLLVTLCFWSSNTFAQSILPEGVGLIQVGERHFANQTNGYDDGGTYGTLANTLPGNLAGTLDQFDLGITINAQIDATILGVAYGLSPSWTVFAGAPYVQAHINASLIYNNADHATIDNAITNLGYAPLGPLFRTGFGDTIIGARTVLHPGAFSIEIDPTLSIPTGYTKDPSILQDVSFGTGYFTFGLAATPKYTGSNLHAEMPLSYKASPEGYETVRLPDDQWALSDRSHQKIVAVFPGQEVQGGLGLGWKLFMFDLDTQIGERRHFHDRYTGPDAGNYRFLSNGSDKLQVFSLTSLVFSTAELYQAKKFAIPFLLGLDYFKTLAGRNVVDESYFQLTFSTFFKTSETHTHSP